jgi:tetratricopeptide (TPR) repeat protein
MEVAMRRSFGQSAVRALFTLTVISSFLALAGCADLVTYSRKANEEGMRCYREGAYGDAAGAFRQAIRQDPRDYRSHFYLGVCFGELNEFQQAFSEYHTTLEVMNQGPVGRADDAFRQEVLDTLASAIAHHDPQEVELNAAEQRAKQGQNAQDWFLMAKIYRLKGDADLALDAYRRASHFDNENFYVRKEAGLFLLAPLNNTKDATLYLLQAYRLNPDDEAVNNALARLGITPEPADKAKSTSFRPANARQPVIPVENSRPAPVRPAGTAQLPRD